MPVGRNDLPQPLFSAPVPAVGVGVKAFHKFLIPGLYLVQAGVFFKIQDGQRVKLSFG
jgi:hypothetical protein